MGLVGECVRTVLGVAGGDCHGVQEAGEHQKDENSQEQLNSYDHEPGLQGYI